MPLGRLTQIDEQEVLRYLGWRGDAPDEPLQDALHRCAESVRSAAEPRVIWRRFPLDGTSLTGTSLSLEGQDIQRHLTGCREAILMAATLGPEVERLLLREEVRNLSDALIMDSCASAAIENVCNNLEGDLRSGIEAEGLFLTHRYSPGYGDLPLSHQKGLCNVLDTQRRIGLNVSDSGILIPRKSVTAVLGVSPAPIKGLAPGCESCKNFETCTLRRDGTNCQNSTQTEV